MGRVHERTESDKRILAVADSLAVVVLHVARINVDVDLPAIAQVAIFFPSLSLAMNPKTSIKSHFQFLNMDY